MADVNDFLIDFSKEEAGGGGGKRVPPGKYPVKITAAKPIKSKEKETPGLELVLLITNGKKKGTKMYETLWATPKAYSRFRILLEACGIKVPSKVNLVKMAAAVKGKELVVEFDDEEREGYKTRSRVEFEGFFSADDVDEDDLDEEDSDDEDEEDTDDLDDDDEEEEDEEPEPPKRKAKKTTAKKKAKPADDEDEELDDLDLDDL